MVKNDEKLKKKTCIGWKYDWRLEQNDDEGMARK